MRLFRCLPSGTPVSSQPLMPLVIHATRWPTFRHRPYHKPRSNGKLLHNVRVWQLCLEERTFNINNDAGYNLRKGDVTVQGRLLT